MTAAQIAAEKAHETPHRCDFWNGNVFVKPCEFLESRGFAAEIRVTLTLLILHDEPPFRLTWCS
jgi:hypothetical protein